MAPLVSCAPATNIGAFSADGNGIVSALDPISMSGNWGGGTVSGADGGPQTIDSFNNFANVFGLTIEDVTTGSFGVQAGGVALDDGITPGVYTHTIDFGYPMTNIALQIQNFASGTAITNISPPVTSVTGDGSISMGGARVDPTDNTFTTVLNFAGPTQTITFTWDTPSPNLGTFNAMSFTGLPNEAYQYGFAWGTTPGGPYPNGVAGIGSTGSSDSFSIIMAPLTPLTPYYYVTQVFDRFGGLVAQGAPECTFMTLAPTPKAFCDGASLIDMTSAVLSGHSELAQAGEFYEIRYGTTPGGPYDHTLGQIPATGASPEAFQAPATNLDDGTTYYFITVVLDSLQHVLVTSLELGPECSFTTVDGTDWCGGLFDPDDCVLVDPGNSEPYLNCNQV